MTDPPSFDIDRVNPYDDPDRQQLERKLQDDQRELQEQHRTAAQEHRYADLLDSRGSAHPATDRRIAALEKDEVRYAGLVEQDKQDLEHWDHAHPDGGHTPTIYDPATTPTWGTGGQQTTPLSDAATGGYQDPGATAYQDPGATAYQDPGAGGYQDPGTGVYQDPGTAATYDPYAQSQDPYATSTDTQQYPAIDPSYGDPSATYDASAESTGSYDWS